MREWGPVGPAYPDRAQPAGKWGQRTYRGRIGPATAAFGS